MSGSVSNNQPTPAQDVAKIHGLLNDNGFLGHDENDHLHQVSKLLSGLNSGDLHQVLTGLNQSDIRSLAARWTTAARRFGGLTAITACPRASARACSTSLRHAAKWVRSRASIQRSVQPG